MQNFPQKGRGLGHVTPKILQTIHNIFKTTSARDLKFGA